MLNGVESLSKIISHAFTAAKPPEGWEPISNGFERLSDSEVIQLILLEDSKIKVVLWQRVNQSVIEVFSSQGGEIHQILLLGILGTLGLSSSNLNVKLSEGQVQVTEQPKDNLVEHFSDAVITPEQVRQIGATHFREQNMLLFPRAMNGLYRSEARKNPAFSERRQFQDFEVVAFNLDFYRLVSSAASIENLTYLIRVNRIKNLGPDSFKLLLKIAKVILETYGK